MKLFFKRKGSDPVRKANVLSKTAQAGYKRMQVSWANWMMKRTENFSKCTWLMLLALFVLSVSVYNIYLVVSSINAKGSASFSITPIKKPKHLTETGEINKTNVEIHESEYNRIKNFRTYMDSLARSPSGKILYDSITMHRPGLMDSVRFIENYYQRLKQK
jgi:hypothetical protein